MFTLGEILSIFGGVWKTQIVECYHLGMKKNNLSTTLVMFGDFSQHATLEKMLEMQKNIFQEYVPDQQTELTPTGPEIVWFFKKNNQRWVIRGNRMDYSVFGDANVDTISADFSEIIQKLSIKGNRVSVLCHIAYVPSKPDDLLVTVGRMLPEISKDGDLHELSIRYNQRKTVPYGEGLEQLNCITTIDKGFVRKISDNSVAPAITLQTDINTLFERPEPRFDYDNLREMFTELWKESSHCIDEAEHWLEIHEEG